MNRLLVAFTSLALLQLNACQLPMNGNGEPLVDEGGENANDRSEGGTSGELLSTGAMTLATNGRYALMQRNRVSVVFDVVNKRHTELSFQVARAVFSETENTVYFAKADGTLLALDLATKATKWSASTGGLALSLLSLSADGRSIIVGTGNDVQVHDSQNGSVRGRVALGATPSYFKKIPGSTDVLVVGDTTFINHAPHTPVARITLSQVSLQTIDVPNCVAPIEVLPDASRALLSPTFCEEGKESSATNDWTNPDPVSIIDLDANGGLHFVKNLPGFGPVALSEDGTRAVAYLDKTRMDTSMFDDPAQVPSSSSPNFHIMTIDPKTLAFELHPIGNALPRFAMTRDGRGLLVDASIKLKTRVKLSAKANVQGNVSFTPNGISGSVTGEVDVEAAIFQEKSPFGYFDLGTNVFTGFAGPQAGIDRFVQLADGRTVIALERRKDGLGGTPHLIDLVTKTVTQLAEPLGTGVRDIGLLPDGKTMLVRVRMAASQKGSQLYSREAAYFSADFTTIIGASIEFEESQPFAQVDPENNCPSYHDCF